MDAEAWDARYAESELVWSAGPNQFVAAECAGLPPGHAVDLAAGEGRNAIWLARRGWAVTAIDFSRVALDKGRTLPGGDAVTWVCADVTTWREDGAYDLAVLAYLQLPAAQRGAAVRSAVSALRPGGSFVLVAHDSSNLTEGTGGPQDSSVLYTAEDVLGDVTGLEVLVERAQRVARVLEPGHRGEPAATAYDCLVRLRRPS